MKAPRHDAAPRPGAAAAPVAGLTSTIDRSVAERQRDEDVVEWCCNSQWRTTGHGRPPGLHAKRTEVPPVDCGPSNWTNRSYPFLFPGAGPQRAADQAVYAANNKRITAVTLRMVAMLTNRSSVWPLATASAATDHRARIDPTATERPEW